jgi:uncharacterized protein (TIGR03435 family)
MTGIDNDEELRHNHAMLGKGLRCAATGLLFAFGLFAQQPDPQTSAAPLEFEVATVKPQDPDRRMLAGVTGGPGSADPGRISYRMTLRRLLLLAFDVTGERLSGPDWLNDTTFDIMAKVPEGSTKEQVRVMLQHLLGERFKMILHHEMQEKAAYDLTVAKTGLKLKETFYPNAKPATSSSLEFTLDKNEFPVLPKDLAVQARVDWVKNGSFRSTFRAYPISAFVRDLVGVLTTMITVSDDPTRTFAARVIDKTGLTGRYDFTLEYAGLGDDATGPNVFSAIEKQLGLKLDKSKAPLDVIVIDHIDKVPVEN